MACGTAVAILAPCAATAASSRSPVRTFDLPTQSLAAMVRAICRTSELNVLFDSTLATGRTAPLLRGAFTAEDALARVLGPAGFTFQWIGDRSILIRRAEPVAPHVDAREAIAVARSRAGPIRTAPVASVEPSQEPPTASPELLDALLVTATRQPDIVSRVPISVTALTQSSLDMQGLKSVQDVARAVPAVTVRAVGVIGQGNALAIRGIASNYGASTTGVYLDDAPLQKRGFSGTFSGNGNPFPVLFDLERIEVLRGPQGTLFGGSSEGGTIRFITPAASLTERSGYGRAEIAHTEGGGPSYEAGLAIGGPILRDKLGFRASFIVRRRGGYIDHVSIYDAHEFDWNTNVGVQRAARLALLWAPAERLRVGVSLYNSSDRQRDADQFIEDIPQYTTNSGVFTNAGVINGIAFDFPDTAFRGGVYGPYNQYGDYKSRVGFYLDEQHAVLPVRTPITSTLVVPSLSIDYSFDKFTVKAITSYVEDVTKGVSPGAPPLRAPILCPTTCTGFVDPVTGLPVPGGTGRMAILPGFPTLYTRAHYNNARTGFTQEFRFLTLPEARPLNAVAGLYYSRQRLRGTLVMPSNENEATIFVRGIPEEWFMGEQNLGINSLEGNLFGIKDSRFDELEVAAFGEANYYLTQALKLTAGVRVSYNRIRFSNDQGGPIYGAPRDFVATPDHIFPNQPGDDPLTHDGGVREGLPLMPKFGVSYQHGRRLLYATMSKGYRAGGVNTRPYVNSCANEIAGGGTPPETYGSDTVTSYELGMKGPLADRAQLNFSLFYITWDNPQLSRRLSCGFNYVVNAGAAVSKGFDAQGQLRIAQGLTLTGSVAYTDAKFTRTVLGELSRSGTPAIIVNDGDELGSAKWQVAVGAQYNLRLSARADAFVRGDYQYSSSYQRGAGPGAVGYDASIVRGAPARYATASVGVNLDRWQVSGFVRNLGASADRLSMARNVVPPDTTVTTYRPREAGLQVVRTF